MILAGVATMLLTVSPAATAEAKTIGVSFGKVNTFLALIRKGVEDRAVSRGDVTLRFEDAGGDPQRQMETLRGFAKDRVDAIVVIPVDGDQGAAISKIASDAGIALVYINNEPANIDKLPPKQAYVGSDEHDSGTLQTAEVCRLLGGKGRIGLMMGELLHGAARQRTIDVQNVVAGKDCAGMTIVEQQSANWSRPQGEQLTREWLNAGVSFDAIIANNDDMALGVITALKSAGVSTDKTLVAGIDATKDALAAVKAGDMKVTILQNANAQGGGALDAAMKISAGEAVPSKIWIPFELVTAKNIDAYLAK